MVRNIQPIEKLLKLWDGVEPGILKGEHISLSAGREFGFGVVAINKKDDSRDIYLRRYRGIYPNSKR